ncbi:transcriptional regulator [Robbsia andropogonis]|uniref:transcriptional regulator n=1 Tax=Robbsia andropogonis TaxID=28092 RepID=UPI0034506D45
MDIKTYIAQGGRGTATKLAEAMGISPSYLSQMSSGKAPISPERCVAFEVHSAGAIRRQDICQNWHSIWPELADVEQVPV